MPTRPSPAAVVALLAMTLATAPVAMAQVTFASIVADDSLAIEPTAITPIIPAPPGLGALSGGSFRITISRAAAANTTVNYSVSGTATAGSDYTALSGSVVIPAGSQTAGITIVGIDDAGTERDETIVVTLTAGTGYATTIGGSSARVVLVDNDQSIRISSADNISSEPQGNVGSARIERLGTLRGRLAIPLVLGGSATNSVDYNSLPDSAVFPDGQADVTLTVSPRPDNDTEGTENVLVRVAGLPFQPAGGVSIELRDATVRVDVAQPTVLEGAGNTASFVLTRSGELAASVTVTVQFGGTATNGVDVVGVPTNVTFAAGSATANVPVSIRADTIVEGPETFVLTVLASATLGAGVPNAATLVIDESSPVSVASLSLSTNVVTGGTPIQVTLLLNGAAPPAGATVTLGLTSPTPGAAQLAVTSLVVPSGQSSSSFTITTSPVVTATGGTVTASLAGTPVQSRNFNISAPLVTAYTFNAPTVTAQRGLDSTAAEGLVTLNGPAPTGLTFTLSSSHAALIVPASITMPPGALTLRVPVVIAPVASTTTVTSTIARNNPLRSATLTLAPAVPASAALSPATVLGQEDGRTLTNATLQLSGAAPAAGVSAAVTAASPASPQSPSLAIAPFATSGSVGVTSTPVSTRTTSSIAVSLGGVTRAATLTVDPPVPTALSTTVDSLVTVSGARLSGSIRLGSPAPQAHTVPLTSSRPQLFACDVRGTPITAVGVSGSTSALPFQLCSTPVTTRTVVTLTAGIAPAVATKSVTLVPEPPRATLVLSDADIIGGLSSATPTGTLVRALTQRTDTVTITSSDPAVGFLQNNAYAAGPQTVIMPAGQGSVGVQFSTKSVATDRTVTLGVSPNSVGASLLVRSPLITRTAAPGTLLQALRPGTTPDLRVLNQSVRAPAGGLPIQLTSSNPVVSVPSIVTVPADSFGTTFAITVGQPSGDVNLTLTAQLGNSTAQLQVKVLGPVGVQSLTVASSSVNAGDSTLATITLTQPAPVGGASVALSGSSGHPFALPSSVLVPEGQSSATFQLKVNLFAALLPQVTRSLTVTASVGGTNRGVSFNVTGFNLAFTPQFTNIFGGDSLVRMLALNLPAPPGGLTIVGTSHPLLTIPDTIVIPAGQTQTAITVRSQPVVSNTSIQIQLRYLGTPVTAFVTVNTVGMSSAVATPASVTGGASFTLTLVLNAPARAGGQVVTFSAPAGSPLTLPATATVPAGTTSITIPIQTSAVAAAIGVPITVGANQAPTRTVTVVVSP